MGTSFGLWAKTIVFAGLLALLAGCGGQSSTTVRGLSVQFDAAANPAAGDAAHPVHLTARVFNNGSQDAWHVRECDVGTGIELHVFGPDGPEVFLQDPLMMPGCPNSIVTLAPGASLNLDRAFTGTLYSDLPDSAQHVYAAPAGTYSVVVSFPYSASQTADWLVVEKRFTFAWGG